MAERRGQTSSGRDSDVSDLVRLLSSASSRDEDHQVDASGCDKDGETLFAGVESTTRRILREGTVALKNLVGMVQRSETSAEGTVEADPKVVIPALRTVAPATSIDASTHLSGKLRCKETIRIDGCVRGEVHCEKTVIIGEAAIVEAAIHAESVVISGGVKGDIAAKRKITLERTAQVTGDLSTPGIVIEEGAKLVGRIVIGADDGATLQKQTTKPRREPASSSSPLPTERVTPPAT